MSVELVKLHEGIKTVIDTNSAFSVVYGDRLMLQCATPEEIFSILVRTDGPAGGIMLNKATSFPYDLGEADQYIPRLFIIVTTSERRTRATYDIRLEAGSKPKPAEDPVSKSKEIPIPKPVPPPVPGDDASKKILELQKQLDQAIKEKNEATDRLTGAEEELAALRAATGLPHAIEEQQAIISQWRKKLDELQNEEYRLRTFDLADAQEQLAERKEQTKKAKEELKAAEKDCAEQNQALAEQKTKLDQTEALLTAQREKTNAMEQELASLQSRHCDAQRAKEELEQKRRDMGLMDDELRAIEDELRQVSQKFAKTEEELKEIRAQETASQEEREKLEAANQHAQEQILELTERQSALNGELKKYESEIESMETLKKQRAKEWEQLVRNFSTLLSKVIREKFDLEETYNLLLKALDSNLVENMKKEAAEQQAKLDDCGAVLAKVSEWIGRIKGEKVL